MIGGALAAVAIMAGGCGKRETTAAPSEAVATADTALDEVEAALGQLNFGDAAAGARRAQQAFPGDVRIQLAAARAYGRLGDASASADALNRARAIAPVDIEAVVAEPAFASVRHEEAFAPFRKISQPVRAAEARSQTEQRLRAGDVEIVETSRGDYVRAGDIVLDSRN